MILYHLNGNELIINLDHVVTMQTKPGGGYAVTMINGNVYTVSSETLIDMLKKIMVHNHGNF